MLARFNISGKCILGYSLKLSFTCLCLFILLFPSCEKEPEIIIKTVIETDTIIVTEVDTVYIELTDTLTLTEFIQDTTTTFILVRHAETHQGATNDDPSLSTEGAVRAETLADILSDTSLSGIYSSPFKRTRQTAIPTSDLQSVPVQTYDLSNLKEFANNSYDKHFGETILVVGHSDTTPDLLNIFIGSNTYENLPGSAYRDLFIVSISELGRAKVLHLKYGI